MRPPNKRKPVAGKATGLLKIDVLAGNIDKQEDSLNPHHLQAARIRAHFPALSWPLAHRVAEIAFGRAA